MADSTSLEGKVAVVTGAGAGLGRAEALALAAAGAKVVVNDLAGAGDDAVEEIRSLGGEAVVVEGDISQRSTADALMTAAIDGFGGLDVVVDSSMRTNLPRVFAAGDITEYPGKVRLIAVGFGEAATAVNNAAVAIDPAAHLFPGHSSEG